MKREYKNWLVADHYMSAAMALHTQGVDDLPGRYINRGAESSTTLLEEFLLTYALEKVAELSEVDHADNLLMAYWQWVKVVTAGDVAWNGGYKKTQWHYDQATEAYGILEKIEGAEKIQVLAAADAFNTGRNEYPAQLTSYMSS